MRARVAACGRLGLGFACGAPECVCVHVSGVCSRCVAASLQAGCDEPKRLITIFHLITRDYETSNG